MQSRQERGLDAASTVGSVSPCQSIPEREREPIAERDRFRIHDSQQMPWQRIEPPSPSGERRGKLEAIKYQRWNIYDDDE